MKRPDDLRPQAYSPLSSAPSPGEKRRWLCILLILGLIALTWTSFAPGLNGEFLNWDDDRNFVDNPAYRGLGMEQLVWAWRTYHLGVWQPLSWLLLGAQYTFGEALGVGGMNPAIYRCTSLVLHTVNAVVFLLLTVNLLKLARAIPTRVDPDARRDRTPPTAWVYISAGVAAALFAVHPLRVEAISWISCQPYLPAALFYMLGVAAYLRYVRAARPGQVGVWFSMTLMCFLLALASKAVAISLPVVLLILDVYPLRRLGGGDSASGNRNGSPLPPGQGRGLQGISGRAFRANSGGEGLASGALRGLRLLAEKLPFFLAAIVVSAWAAAAKDYNDTRIPFSAAALNARMAQSVYGLIFYLIKTVAPWDLSAYYRLPVDLSLSVWRYGAAAAGIAAVTLVLVALSIVLPRLRSLAAAWFAYVIILLPNLGLVQISQQIAADRYSYLAVMPLMILFAGVLLKLIELTRLRARISPVVLVGAMGLAIGLMARTTRRQTLVWNDSASLWRAVLAIDPDCTVADCNLGAALLSQGDFGAASRHLSRAIERDADFAWAYSNFGVILLQAGRFEDAVVAFEQALAVRPPLRDLDRAKTHAGLGEAYANLRRYDLARQHALIARDLGFDRAERLLERLPHPSSGASPPSE